MLRSETQRPGVSRLQLVVQVPKPPIILYADTHVALRGRGPSSDRGTD
jgi:hypothetical protein